MFLSLNYLAQDFFCAAMHINDLFLKNSAGKMEQ